jgi:hypothetical protein
LTDFAEQIGSDASYCAALTYQEMCAPMLSVVGQEHADYMEYPRDRYVNRSMLYSSRERSR